MHTCFTHAPLRFKSVLPYITLLLVLEAPPTALPQGKLPKQKHPFGGTPKAHPTRCPGPLKDGLLRKQATGKPAARARRGMLLRTCHQQVRFALRYLIAPSTLICRRWRPFQVGPTRRAAAASRRPPPSPAAHRAAAAAAAAAAYPGEPPGRWAPQSRCRRLALLDAKSSVF